MLRTFSWRGVLLICLALVSATGLLGQTAEITGRVTDSTGAVVPEAAFTVTNVDTGIKRNTTSNAVGYYRIPLLQPGDYRISVRMEGFRPITRTGVTLVVDQIARVDFALEVGPVTETIEVAGEAPLLESETATFGQVVTQRNIEELPLNARDPMFLITLTPGVTTGGSFDQSRAGDQNAGRNWFKANFSVGGGRNYEQEVLLDGSPNTSADRNYVLYIPPVDSTQEFKVLANPHSAEYGRTAGGVVTMVTKSGTNEYHGVAYYFHRNSALDANSFFNNRGGLDKVSFKRHQFGANIGGPILHEKTFFFLDYEGFRQAFPATFISTVPTALQKRGDFSQTFTKDGRLITIYDPSTLQEGPDGQLSRLPLSGNVIPQSFWDPVASSVISHYPDSNLPGDPVTRVDNLITATRDTTNLNKYSFRVDHNISSAHRIFGRLSIQRGTRDTPGRWEGPSGPSAIDRIDNFYNTVVSYNWTLSPTTIFEFRPSFARGFPTQSRGESVGFDLAQLNFPANLLSVAHLFFPEFEPADLTSIGNAFINTQPRNTYAVAGNVSKMAGSHTLKFGFDIRALRFHRYQDQSPAGTYEFDRLFTQGPDPLRSRADAGHGLASFLLGTGTDGEITHRSGLSLQRMYYAFYVQDDWKLTNRLTVNLGLRYDVTTGTSERFDRLAWMDLDARSPLGTQLDMPLRGILEYVGTNGNRRNQLLSDKNNFAPRLGLGYQLNSTASLRAGYGIFFVPMITRDYGSIGFQSATPWVATIDDLRPENLLRNPFPKGFNLPEGTRDPLTNIGFRINGYTDFEPIGYTQQWNLSLQRRLATDTLLDLSYWGNKGTALSYGAGFEENFLPNQFLELGKQLNERVANPFAGLIASGPLSGSTVARRQLLLPFPQYTSVQRNRPMAASSIYHAFTLKLEKRASRGLNVLLSYTVSKIIGDSSARLGSGGVGGIQNMQDRRAERHILGIDAPQRLVGGFVYDLPFGRDKRFGSDWRSPLNAVFGGWRFSGLTTFQSGFPVDIRRPAVNNGMSAKLAEPTIERWFATSVFSPADPFTFGNVGPTLPDVRRDGINNFDFTLAKDFFVRERVRIQLRSEFFNAFNTPQFGDPNNRVTSAAFGRVASQVNAPREIQFGLKLYW